MFIEVSEVYSSAVQFHTPFTREHAGHVGASVSELYLFNKLLINIEDSRSMCDLGYTLY